MAKRVRRIESLVNNLARVSDIECEMDSVALLAPDNFIIWDSIM